jgi:2-polyprenyl-3-methyl-5-hydroxy-6-metoxy-1,4-benzoquinol methylase
MEENINRTMSPEHLRSAEAREIIQELNALILDLRARGLKTSAWYGRFDLTGDPGSSEVINRGPGYTPLPGAADDRNFPWFLYWEIVWVVLHAGFRPGQRVLDLGGSSSLFSYYLASKGLEVDTVELQQRLVDNADTVANATGWPLRNHCLDMRKLAFSTPFDHITSICVYEHIPMYDRVEINKLVKDLLVPGGRFSITFDYRNPSRRARIDSPQAVEEQFIAPSGLSVRGNRTFLDSGENYLLNPFYSRRTSLKKRISQIRKGHFPLGELFRTKVECDYTFAALFMEKDPEE